MRFSAPAADLRDALSNAAHATPDRPEQVAYSGCLLVVRKGRLSVIGSDGETTIAARVHAGNTADGQALLPPKPLRAFLTALPPELEVTVEASDAAEVTVTAGSLAPYRFRQVAGTFPMPPSQKDKPQRADFTRLASAVAAVRPAVPREPGGLEVVSDASGLSLRATDNFRIHAAWLPEAGFGEFSGVMSLAVLDRLSRLDIDGVTTDGRGRTVRFSGPEVVVSARLLAVQFPPLDAYLKMRQPVEFLVPADPLADALARIASVAESAPVFVFAAGRELRLEVSNADLGSGVEVITLESPVPAEVQFAADRQFFAEAIACHEAETLEMSWAASLNPVLLRSSEPFPVLTVVQPIRASYTPVAAG